MSMRSDIDVAIDLMEAARTKIRQLMVMADEYRDQDDGKHAIWARVDLGHAEHELKRAIGFTQRLIVNGQKPWDQVDA